MTTNLDTTPLHVIFGAGQIGAGLARTLRDRGLRVRVVRRSDRPVGDGIEVWAGDARDTDFATRAADGAAVVYHCTNPSKYTGKVWARELPALGEAIIAAAAAAGARLVVLDNLYAYGPHAEPLTEETEMNPAGRKGAVRKAWHQRLRRAWRDEGLRVVIGRAGDFFGPGADGALVNEAAVRGLPEGKRPLLVGDPDSPHAFSYIPDVIDALAALGGAGDDVDGQIFHLPVHEIAPAQLYRRIGEALGVDVRPKRMGKVMFRLLSPVASIAREMLETFYQWDRPFAVDDSKFRARFPEVGGDFDDAIAGTAALALPTAPPHGAGRTARAAGGAVAVALFLALAPAARAEGSDAAPANLTSSSDHQSHFHGDFEIDPTAYVASGHSLHVGIGYDHLRVDLGAYAMQMPKFFTGDDDFDLSMNGYGIKVQYYLFHEQRGGFVGVDGGVTHILSRLEGTDLARRQRMFGVGVNAGWRFTLPAGFYVTPWLGVSYNFGVEDVMLGGKTQHNDPVVVFPAVHLGYRFR